MLIGVFSDVHDNLGSLERVLGLFRSRQISTLLFCGDFCSPIPARRIAAYPGQVHCVFGNGDGDRFAMLRHATTEAPNMQLHGEYAELTLERRRVALTHYPLYGQALARTGDYDAVFSGHTHEAAIETHGGCLWVNPGEVLGWRGGPSCAIYDTETNSAEIIRLEVVAPPIPPDSAG